MDEKNKTVKEDELEAVSGGKKLWGSYKYCPECKGLTLTDESGWYCTICGHKHSGKRRR